MLPKTFSAGKTGSSWFNNGNVASNIDWVIRHCFGITLSLVARERLRLPYEVFFFRPWCSAFVVGFR